MIISVLNGMAPSGLWRRFVQGLRRVESERYEQGVDLDQARIRRIVSWCIFPWWFWGAFTPGHAFDWAPIWMNVAFIIVAELFYRHYRRHEVGTMGLRVLGVLIDQGTCTLTLVWAGANASPLFFVFIWVAVGNALRFGTFYAGLSTLLGIAGFLCVCALGSEWSANREILISWAVAIAVIPVYVAVLARRIHRAKHVMRREEEQMRYAALHDPLTGLANRACFEGQVAGELVMLKEPGARRSSCDAVLFIDLDGFKTVNDAYGHSVGDALLKTVAATLSNRLRAIDTVARLGGDEFAALLTGVRSVADVDRVAQQLVTDIAAITTINGHAVHISASIGIGIIDANDTVPDVIKRADESMYEAKKGGKNRTAFTRVTSVGGRRALASSL